MEDFANRQGNFTMDELIAAFSRISDAEVATIINNPFPVSNTKTEIPPKKGLFGLFTGRNQQPRKPDYEVAYETFRIITEHPTKGTLDPNIFGAMREEYFRLSQASKNKG